MPDSSLISSPHLPAGIHVIDGGMATELEKHGASIDGPLWSAHVLEDAPEKILAVHRSYIEAGADCILTASYQASRKSYLEYGYTAARADQALLKSVALARQAAAEYTDRRILVVSSLGPYGAALHNGAEYHGNYNCPHAELVAFHRERLEVLASATGDQAPDLLAFETLPSLDEARALTEALRDFPTLRGWVTFTCRDGHHVAHGEPISDCAQLLAALPQILAVGLNCTAPSLVASLIADLKSASSLPVIVYPNSGENWDGEHRCWTGIADVTSFGQAAELWFNSGAALVGGCCRTGPEHIRAVAQAASHCFASGE